jgi:hypothetical protein
VAKTYQIDFYDKEQKQQLDWVVADSEEKALKRIHQMHKIERIVSIALSKYTLEEIAELD